jgi:small conductance mechanosensitive channel
MSRRWRLLPSLLAFMAACAPFVALGSDTEQLFRIEQVIELDRQKLAELRADISKREAFFEWIAGGLATTEAKLTEKRTRLQALGEGGDATERSDLEAEISKLEVEMDLVQTQSEIAYTTLTTVRDQITALEKKIERERRALDALEGGMPELPSTEPSAIAPTDSRSSALPQALPPMMRAVAEVASADRAATTAMPAASPLLAGETTAQIEALRELERRQGEAAAVHQAMVEFVKRNESLSDQISIEGKLLEAAKDSEQNTMRALEIAQADLDAAKASRESGPELRRLQESAARVERMHDDATREIEERTVYIASLQERLQKLRQEELSVTAESQAAHEAVNEARSKLRWLRSPVHPDNLLRWARERGPRILFVLAVLIPLLALLRIGIRLLVAVTVRNRKGRDSRADRAATLALSFRSAASLVILVVGVFMVFQEAGVDVKTVLGGAAILGVAFAFGAQNLMRDYFTGFLILLESQFELGDVITIAGITGTVESVTMRVTMLRDLEGRVHFVPNGEIKAVTNRTYQWGRAVVEIPIRYDEDVDRVMEKLSEVAQEMRADLDYAERITEDPVMLGVDAFTEYGVVIKFMLKTLPEEMFTVRRELLRRVKKKFDEHGIEISVPHRVVQQIVDEAP